MKFPIIFTHYKLRTYRYRHFKFFKVVIVFSKDEVNSTPTITTLPQNHSFLCIMIYEYEKVIL